MHQDRFEGIPRINKIKRQFRETHCSTICLVVINTRSERNYARRSSRLRQFKRGIVHRGAAVVAATRNGTHLACRMSSDRHIPTGARACDGRDKKKWPRLAPSTVLFTRGTRVTFRQHASTGATGDDGRYASFLFLSFPSALEIRRGRGKRRVLSPHRERPVRR